jgi:nicotinamidase-related amidase
MPIDLTDLLRGSLHGRGRSATPPIAVVTMELQRGVMGDLASFPALEEAARAVGLPANAGRLVDAARHLGLPVVHCTAEFRADRAGTTANTPLHSAVLRRAEHLLEGTPAVELIPELGPASSDVVVPRRHGVSPFSGTPLDTTLRNLGVSVLLVTGVSVNLGVLGLAIEAVNLGYQVAIATDAVCGFPADYSRRVLGETLSLIATLATTEELLAAMTTAAVPPAGSVERNVI